MKKFLFTMMAALLVCGMSFAQPKANRTLIPISKKAQQTNLQKSNWVGERNSWYLYKMEEGDEIAIVPSVFDENISGSITKVAVSKTFYDTTYNDFNQYMGNSFTIKIYENINLTGTYAEYGLYDLSSTGDPVYTQDFTTPTTWDTYEDGMYEVELTTPYVIPTDGRSYWIAVKANEKATFTQSNVNTIETTVGGQYTYYTEEGYGTFWTEPIYSNNTLLYNVSFAAYYDDGSTYQEQADLKVYFGDKKPGSSGINEIDQISIGETDDLVIYPFFLNNGPDAITSPTCHVTLDVIIGGETINLLESDEDFSEDPFPNGYYFYYEAEGHVFGADQIALYEVTEFQVVAKVEDLQNDPNETNNMATLTVNITHANPVQNLVATPEGANVVLTWEAPEPCEGLSLGGYKIYRDGAQVGMKPAGTETYTQNDVPDGTYEYCVVAVYNQTVLSEEVCVEATADGINEMAENIAVYPNPATTALKVANVEGANILVINSLGQVVANIENAKEMQEINVEGLAEGIYTVRIANETGVVTKQFCVKK